MISVMGVRDGRPGVGIFGDLENGALISVHNRNGDAGVFLGCGKKNEGTLQLFDADKQVTLSLPK